MLTPDSKVTIDFEQFSKLIEDNSKLRYENFCLKLDAITTKLDRDVYKAIANIGQKSYVWDI